MSLVNQVLKDLDDRRPQQATNDALVGLKAAPPVDRSSYKAGIAFAAIALIGVIGWLAWHYLPAPDPASDPATEANTPLPTKPSVVTAPAVAKPPSNDSTPTESALPVPEPSAVPMPGVSPAVEPLEEIRSVPPAPMDKVIPATAPRATEPAPHSSEAGHVEPTMSKTQRPLSPAEQAEQHYVQAVSAIREGRWRVAEQELNVTLEAVPSHTQARETLAGMLLKQDRRREAQAVLKAGLERSPYYPGFAKPYARLILDQGRDEEAIRTLETALTGALDDADYLGLLAAVYQRNQRYADAVSSYRGALSLQPKRAAWWLGLALVLEHTGELRRAEMAYRSAVQNPGLNDASRQFAQRRLQRLAALMDRN